MKKLLPLLLTLAAPQGSDEAWYKIDVTITTTSDWTAIRFANAPRSWVDDQQIATARETKVTTGALSIHKASYDATETTLTAAVYLQLPAKGDVEIVVTRGSIGATKITIRAVGEITHDTATGEGTNRRSFSVSAEKVRALGPVKLEKKKRGEKRVLAFYYPWYGSEGGPSKRWVHWDPDRHNAATNTPELGLYDSNDEAVIRKHITWAKSAGIDGFIASWWGPKGFEDRAMRKLVEIAEKEKFLVSAYHEQARDAAQLADEVAFLVKEYGSSPAWLKVDDKPVIFVYTRVVGGFRPADFAKARGGAVLIMDTFDPGYGKAGGGLHTYNPAFEALDRLREAYQSASLACAAHGLVFAATVVPGYDDTVIRKPGGKRDRDKGRFYDASWECALASEPDWILVCSWNEWHEGSEIEPSKEYGDLYLTKTAEWVKKWKGR